MLKKVLLTGGCGFLGGNIIKEAQTRLDFEIHAVDNHILPSDFERVFWYPIDLREKGKMEDLFFKIKPDVVIHTAAISDIDYCENHRETAKEVNVDVTKMLAELSISTGSRLIWFSSDAIFDGIGEGYDENDSPCPLNYYAQTKVEAESIVSSMGTNWTIVRPSLILGFPVWEQGNSFLWRMIREMKINKEVAFPRHEIRTPIDVITLSRAALELAELNYTGIIHIAGNTSLSRFDMAVKIAEAFGLLKELVKDQLPMLESKRAPRAANASLNNRKAAELLKTPLLDIDEAIDLIKKQYGRPVQ